MGYLELLILGLLLNVAQCLETLGLGKAQHLEITNNVTAVLRQDIYLNCTYLGEEAIGMAEWKREVDGESKRLVGLMTVWPFSRDANFSSPNSVKNLTIRMAVSRVNAKGKYTCEIVSDNKNKLGSVSLTVVAEPDIHIQVNEETVNGTHYQSVPCMAVAHPTPEVSWLVDGLDPPQDIFTVEQNKTAHPNGTSTMISALRFPTHLQEEENVTCMVQHPTLLYPALTTVRVDTFVRPNVSIKAEMVRQRGSEYWVVSCVASGGTPDTDIFLAVDSNEELNRENKTNPDSQICSVHLPVAKFEGHNVTCVFKHPKFTHRESRVIALPKFYLSGVQLLFPGVGNGSVGVQTTEALELTEGQTDVLIRMNVTGNVPSYTVTCTKDAGALPEALKLVGSVLSVEGPVSPHHSGLYECVFSFHNHTTTLHFNLTVKTLPVAPSVSIDLRTEGGHSVIECTAADAVPAAEVSWLLPEGVSVEYRFNVTSQNRSHSVRGLVVLPACTPRELTVQCMINHPALQKPQNTSVKLPLCAHPNISLSSSPEWRQGEAYTKVDCSVESVAPAAAITWKIGNITCLLTETRVSEVQSDGSVSTRSSVHVPSALYLGQNLSCVVEHLSLEAPEERALHITEHKAPELSASVNRPQGSPLWTAECVCSGQGVGTNLTWLLPQHLQNHTSLDSSTEGSFQTVRRIYLFPLSLHADQDLTCEHHSEHGLTQRRTVHVPQYYISLKVINHTMPLQNRHGVDLGIHRLALQKSLYDQRILLRVEGNVPDYTLTCQRSDGSFVQMEGAAMLFRSELMPQDEGLYTCLAYFCHHSAAVNIQVEVTSEEKQFLIVVISCISSALALALILGIIFWVLCKRNPREHYKKQESLSMSALTTLMQEPGSPDGKGPVVVADGKEYAQLVNYSIVIDVKSTV